MELLALFQLVCPCLAGLKCSLTGPVNSFFLVRLLHWFLSVQEPATCNLASSELFFLCTSRGLQRRGLTSDRAPIFGDLPRLTTFPPEKGTSGLSPVALIIPALEPPSPSPNTVYNAAAPRSSFSAVSSTTERLCNLTCAKHDETRHALRKLTTQPVTASTRSCLPPELSRHTSHGTTPCQLHRQPRTPELCCARARSHSPNTTRHPFMALSMSAAR